VPRLCYQPLPHGPFYDLHPESEDSSGSVVLSSPAFSRPLKVISFVFFLFSFRLGEGYIAPIVRFLAKTSILVDPGHTALH